VGRTKALLATILIYSLFTGLSAAAGSWWQLATFRFLTGLGLGGGWGARGAVVGAVLPDRLWGRGSAILPSAAAFGYFLAAVINLKVGVYSWRYVYLVGAVPALFVLFIRFLVREPDRWVEARDLRKHSRGSASGPLADPELLAANSFTLKQLF